MADEIQLVSKTFGKHLSQELKTSFDKAVRDGSKGHRVQEPKMNFNPLIEVTAQGIKIRIVATGDYWRNVEYGRKKGKKMPPASAITKKWMSDNGINPAKAVQEITLKYYNKKGLKYNVKKLKFDKAVKQLSYVVRRGISLHGIKPKPFKDRVLTETRLSDFMKTISLIVGKNLKAEFQ